MPSIVTRRRRGRLVAAAATELQFARRFDGGASWLEAPSSASLQSPSTAVTVACHARFYDAADSGGSFASLVQKIHGVTVPFLSYAIQQNGSTWGAYRFRVGDGTDRYSTADLTLVAADVWYWIVGTWSSNQVLTCRLFNSSTGALIETVQSAGAVAGPIGYNGDPLRVAANENDNPDPAGQARADIAGLVVHNTVISDGDLSSFRQGVLPFPPSGGYWPIPGDIQSSGVAADAVDVAQSNTAVASVLESIRVDGPLQTADETGPEIVAESIGTPTSTTVTVSWITDEHATAIVRYGTSDGGPYGSSETGRAAADGVVQAVQLTGLTAGQTYYFVRESTDATGNTTQSAQGSLTTAAASSTPPTITNVAATPGVTTATVTWDTDEAADSQVDYGTSAPILDTQADAGAGSTDFPGSALEAGWTSADQVGDCTFTVADGQLTISIPTGSHDPGTTNNQAGLGAPRVERVQADTDFDVYVKFNSDPFTSGNLSGNGVLVRTDTSSARHDVYADGDTNGLAFVKYGTTTPATGDPTNLGQPSHLRLQRVGDVFTFSYSFDGATWTQSVQYTWAVTVTHIGVYCFNAGGTAPAYTGRVDYVHTSDTPPVVEADADLGHERLLTEPFATLDAGVWTDGSETGGTATVSAGVLTLSCATTDRSTGRVVSVADYPEDVGVTLRVRDSSAAPSGLFLGVVLRGQDDAGDIWAGQYAPPFSYVLELSPANTTVRIMRVGGEHAPAADGAKWSYLRQASDAAVTLDTAWTRFRFEAVGTHIRYRAWDDGAAEPATWTGVLDHAVQGGGKVGFAWSHNDGVAVAGSVEIDDVDIYEIHGSLAASVSNATLVTSHSEGLSALTEETEYHYRVRSTDDASNENVSPAATFTTTTASEVTHGHQIDSTNTGVIGAGFTYDDLTPSGSITTTSDGQVIELLDISGTLTIAHNNVTVRHCRIDAGGGYEHWTTGIELNGAPECIKWGGGSYTGTTVEWSEICNASSAGITLGNPITIHRCDIHRNVDHVKSSGGCTITESFLHHQWHGWTGTETAHTDGFQARSGSDYDLQRNRIEGIWGTGTAAVLFQAKAGSISNVQIRDNVLSGCAYSLYTTAATGNSFTNLSITGNYWVGEDSQKQDNNPDNSWRSGPHSSGGVSGTKTGNFFAPVQGGGTVNGGFEVHPLPLDLDDLRVY